MKTVFTPQNPKKRANSKRNFAIHSVYIYLAIATQGAIHSVAATLHPMYTNKCIRSLHPSTNGHHKHATHSASVQWSRLGQGKTYHSNRKCAIIVHSIHTTPTVTRARARPVSAGGPLTCPVVHGTVCHAAPCPTPRGLPPTPGIARTCRPGQGDPLSPYTSTGYKANQEGGGGLRRMSPPRTNFSGTSLRSDVWDGASWKGSAGLGLMWTAAVFDGWDGWCRYPCATNDLAGTGLGRLVGRSVEIGQWWQGVRWDVSWDALQDGSDAERG